jgi:hypothetical protein
MDRALLYPLMVLCQLISAVRPINSDVDMRTDTQRAPHFCQSCMTFPLIAPVFIGSKWYKGINRKASPFLGKVSNLTILESFGAKELKS